MASSTQTEYKNLCDSSEQQAKRLIARGSCLYGPQPFGSNSTLLFARDHVVGNQRLYRISTLVLSAILPSVALLSSLRYLTRLTFVIVARSLLSMDPASFHNLHHARVKTQVISAGPGGGCTGRIAYRERGLPTPNWPIAAPRDLANRVGPWQRRSFSRLGAESEFHPDSLARNSSRMELFLR